MFNCAGQGRNGQCAHRERIPYLGWLQSVFTDPPGALHSTKDFDSNILKILKTLSQIIIKDYARFFLSRIAWPGYQLRLPTYLCKPCFDLWVRFVSKFLCKMSLISHTHFWDWILSINMTIDEPLLNEICITFTFNSQSYASKINQFCLSHISV